MLRIEDDRDRVGGQGLPGVSLGHVALRVADVSRSRTFYETLFGMRPIWEPEHGHIYLSTGSDILALHQTSKEEIQETCGRLDHLGFLAHTQQTVDEIAKKAQEHGLTLLSGPQFHRDGSYSFYTQDPDGNKVQILCCPLTRTIGDT